jgi:parallel beta-helix repeat protein
MKERLNFRGFGLVILICLLLFFPTSVWATDYYVDIARPDNSGDGLTPGTAWKTLHYGIAQINAIGVAGDVLHVAAGTYSSPDELDEVLTITRSGITVKGAGAEMTVIDGFDATNWDSGIIINASNVTISDLDVTNFTGEYEGILISSGSVNIIERCDIYRNDYGIYIDSASSDNIIRNGCWIFQNYEGIYIQGTGIAFYSAGTGNEVYQNNIYLHWDRGIYVRDSSPEIRKNSIYDNNNGIFVLGDDGTASPSISNNLIYDTIDAMSDGIHLETGSTSGTASPTIYHNTIDGGTSDGVFVSAFDGSASPVIKYNIITAFGNYGIANDSAYPGSPVIEYNDVWNNGTVPADNYSNCTGGTGSMSSDPLYASYELQAGSPCIDAIPSSGAGDTATEDIEGNPRPQGDGHDMGCYENPVIIPQTIPIPPGIEVADYRMISFTVVPPDPGCVTVFGDEMGGIYDEDNFRIGAYDPTISGYVDCGGGLVIEPGRAYWVLARNAVDFTVNGIPASMSNTEVELLSGDGWNQIASPNDANYPWDDVKVLEYDSEGCVVSGPTAISDLSVNNDLIDTRLWRWDAGTYYDDTATMVKGEGYWVKAKKENVFLRFDQEVQIELAQHSNPGIMFASVWNKAKRWVKKCFAPETAIADSGDSPPMPMVDLSVSSSGADSGGGSGTDSDGGGGGGGCFIETVAMD